MLYAVILAGKQTSIVYWLQSLQR